MRAMIFNKPAAVVFDFDGTLADTTGLIVACYQATYQYLAIVAPPPERIAATIGLSLEAAFALLTDMSEQDAAAAARCYRTLFMEREINGSVSLEPFAGMPEVVAHCVRRGMPRAVGSSRGHDSLDPMLRSLGLFDSFDLVVDHSDAGVGKPDPAMLTVIADRLGVPRSDLLMIGDTTYDIEMGNNAGCRTIAVTWGNHDRRTLSDAGPTHIVDRPEEIISLLSGAE